MAIYSELDAGMWLNENLGIDKAASRPARGKTSFIVILSLFKHF
jgi:hypothetical protein